MATRSRPSREQRCGQPSAPTWRWSTEGMTLPVGRRRCPREVTRPLVGERTKKTGSKTVKFSEARDGQAWQSWCHPGAFCETFLE